MAPNRSPRLVRICRCERHTFEIRNTDAVSTAQPDRKKVIFISHASSEASIALALKAALVKGFGSVIDVFVSSDDQSIQAGVPFAATIHTAIRNASYGLFLLSPESIQRPWILIEFGAFWGIGKPAAPILHSGLTFDALASPIRDMNAIELTDAARMKKLVANIAREIDSAPPTVSFKPVLTAAARHAEMQKKTRHHELIQALALLVQRGPVNTINLLREGRQEFTLRDDDQHGLAAVAFLINAGLVLRREGGRMVFDGVKHTRFTLEGTPRYTELLIDAEFLHGLRQHNVEAPPTLEVQATDAAQFSDRGILEKVTKVNDPASETPLQQAAHDPDAFQDYLDAALPIGRRAVLKDVLSFLVSQPTLRSVFLAWAVRDGQLLGQPWFIRPTLVWVLEHASGNELLACYEFIEKSMTSLLDAEKFEEARELYTEGLDNLKKHTDWGNEQMNTVLALTTPFWYVNSSDLRTYKSPGQGQELQEMISAALGSFTRTILQSGTVSQVQEQMEAFASLVEVVPGETLLSRLDRIGQDHEAMGRMTYHTIWQVLNALDQSRALEAGDAERRVFRNRFVDSIAADFLAALRFRPDVREQAFADAVRRAGLRLVNDEVKSRYAEIT